MTENSFEQKLPRAELPSMEEYKQMGAEIYKIIHEVESNSYSYNPERELLLLEIALAFDELLKTRIKKAILAELDLGKVNLETIDPEKVVKSAQAKYKKSEQTSEDDAKRWGSIFYAMPLWAVDQAMGAYKLIQERGLSKPEKPLRFNEQKLKYPAKDFPEIGKFGKPGKQPLIEKIKRRIENTSNN